MSIHILYNICIDMHQKTFTLKYEMKYLFNGSLCIFIEKIK